jgi:hypothetical protein
LKTFLQRGSAARFQHLFSPAAVMNDPSLLSSPEALGAVLVPMFCIGGFFLLGLFLLTGYSMKFALAAAGVGRFGFWKSISLVSTSTLLSMLVSGAVVFSMPNSPFAALVAMVGSVACFTILVSLVGQCGIGRAFVTYILNGIFNLIGAVPLVGLLIAGIVATGVSSGLKGIDIDQLKTQMASARSSIPDGGGFDTGLEGFDLTKVSGQFTAEPPAVGLDNLPEQLPSTITADDSSSGLLNAFFMPEKSSPYPVPKRSGCENGSCSTKRPSGSTPAEPVTSGLQSNPFAGGRP